MLLNLISPTNGEGRLFGAPLDDPSIRALVGFLPEHFRFHDWLRADEFLALHADLYHMPHDQTRQRIPELLDLVGLTTHTNKKLREFSKGMLQRIRSCAGLLNKPKLVILDEPTSGLDPVGRRLVRDIIRDTAPARHDSISELPLPQRSGNHMRPGRIHQAWQGYSYQHA